MGFPDILIIGDVHAPFTIQKTLDRIVDSAASAPPKHIVQVGDLYDLYSFAKFPRSRNIYTPKDEIKLGREVAEKMWDRLKKAAPQAKCWQLRGNHDARPYKRVIEACPEIEDELRIDRIWRFDGVESMLSDRDELIINRIVFMHGFRKFGEHVVHNRLSTVCGHLHTGGVRYVRFGKATLFELNAGFCGNPNSTPLGYTPQKKVSTWTQGFARIDAQGPRFIATPNP